MGTFTNGCCGPHEALLPPDGSGRPVELVDNPGTAEP